MKSLSSKLGIPYTSVSRIVYLLTSEASPGGVLKLVPDSKDRRRKNIELDAEAGAHRRVAGAAEALDRGYTQARSDLARAATATTDYVTANPGKALLLVASAGFVLGLLARGRRPSA
mgnify:CR=1 FL=1